MVELILHAEFLKSIGVSFDLDPLHVMSDVRIGVLEQRIAQAFSLKAESQFGKIMTLDILFLSKQDVRLPLDPSAQVSEHFSNEDIVLVAATKAQDHTDKTLRFKVDENVWCKCGTWKAGVIRKVHFTAPRIYAPYQVQLFEGKDNMIIVPSDDDSICKALVPAWWEAIFKPTFEPQDVAKRKGKTICSVNEKDFLNATLLYRTIECKWLDGVKQALWLGSDPNIACLFSESLPIHLAAQILPEAVPLLLESKADPNKLDKDSENDQTCFVGRTAAERDWHSTALHYAASCSAEDDALAVCCALLDSDADINVKDGEGATALHRAVEASSHGVVAFLLSRNANCDLGFSLYSSTLHQAVHAGDLASVRLLLQHRADVNLEGGGGKTALDMAVRKRNKVLYNELVAAGADETVLNDSLKICNW